MLTAEEAVAADDAIDRTLAAACLAVTVDGLSLSEAVAVHLAVMREHWPHVYGLVAARLRETSEGPDLYPYLGDGGRRL